MGARTYIIKEEKGKFIAVYSHWGADKIRDFVGTKEELKKFLLDLWEEAYKEEKERGDEPLIYELKTIEDLYKFIDFERIDIEVYPVFFENGNIEIFITLIRLFVNGAIRINNFDYPYKLRWAFSEAENIMRIIDFCEALRKTREQTEKDLKLAWRVFKNKHIVEDYDLIISKNLYEAIKNYEILPLRTIGGIVYY
jgi:hypothetical protein